MGEDRRFMRYRPGAREPWRHTGKRGRIGARFFH
jgi:hypothetical protein